MTPNSAYLQYLDREIEMHEKHFRLSPKYDRDEYRRGCADALGDAKAKFLSLYPSQTIDSQEVDNEDNPENNFTDGLD